MLGASRTCISPSRRPPVFTSHPEGHLSRLLQPPAATRHTAGPSAHLDQFTHPPAVVGPRFAGNPRRRLGQLVGRRWAQPGLRSCARQTRDRERLRFQLTAWTERPPSSSGSPAPRSARLRFEPCWAPRQARLPSRGPGQGRKTSASDRYSRSPPASPPKRHQTALFPPIGTSGSPPPPPPPPPARPLCGSLFFRSLPTQVHECTQRSSPALHTQPGKGPRGLGFGGRNSGAARQAGRD